MIRPARRRKAPDTDSAMLDVLIGSSRRPLALSSWMSVLGALLFVAELGFIAQAIAEILRTSSVSPALPYVAAVAALALLRIATDGVATALAARATEDVKVRARDRLAAAIANISPIDKTRPHAGELASLLAGHVDALGPYLTRYRPARLRAALVPFAVLIVTAYFSWAAAIVLLITGPLIPIFMALIGGQARLASEKQLQEIGGMNGVLLDRLRGLTTLTLFDAIPRATAAILREGEAIRTRTMAVLRVAFLSSAVLELFAALGVAFAAVYVGFNLLGHLSFGAYGELSLFGGLFVLMVAPEYFRPLRDFAAAYHDRAAALAASREIGKLVNGTWLTLPQREKIAAPLKTLEVERATVALGGRTVLPELSLSMKRGERVALVSPSGSGKSMLLALLAGLVAPAKGAVKLNGIAGASCEIAWLGQKPAFLQGSLAFNLSMYRRAADRGELTPALRIAQAEEVVARLDRGCHEILRENAANLSGGEAQRLAIARLALSKAELILADEPTEHLDAETARAVIDGLFELSRGRTLVVATHDPRIVARADRVIDIGELRRIQPLEAAA